MSIHYETLLAAVDADNSEEEIHRLLANDPLRSVLPALFGWRVSEAQVISKPGLHKSVPDFAVSHLVKTTGMREWALIELERPSMSLFTRSGDPRSELTHAVNQITVWRSWIMQNIAYARTLLPDVSPTFTGIVVMGRRSSLEASANALAAYNDSLLNVRVRTFDWILDKVLEVGL